MTSPSTWAACFLARRLPAPGATPIRRTAGRRRIITDSPLTFARLSRDGGTLRAVDRGEVEHPKTGRPLAPKPLGAPALPRAEAGDRRVELAEWLTAPDNPYFARSLANRVWRHLLGRGLVEPVDDLRPTNPPTHPGLLKALAAELVEHRFDLRHLVRTIVSSSTYQLTSRALDINRSDRQLYSHAFLKPLEAPVFADAVAQVTGVPDIFEHHPPGTRAVQLIGPSVPSPALDVLGRCQRKTPCDSPSRAGGGLAQALHLINGPTINGKLRGGIAPVLREKSNREAVEELYLRAFTRPPDPDELADWQAWLTRAGDRSVALQDLLWALLNSREFCCNH